VATRRRGSIESHLSGIYIRLFVYPESKFFDERRFAAFSMFLYARRDKLSGRRGTEKMVRWNLRKFRFGPHVILSARMHCRCVLQPAGSSDRVNKGWDNASAILNCSTPEVNCILAEIRQPAPVAGVANGSSRQR